MRKQYLLQIIRQIVWTIYFKLIRCNKFLWITQDFPRKAKIEEAPLIENLQNVAKKRFSL